MCESFWRKDWRTVLQVVRLIVMPVTWLYGDTTVTHTSQYQAVALLGRRCVRVRVDNKFSLNICPRFSLTDLTGGVVVAFIPSRRPIRRH